MTCVYCDKRIAVGRVFRRYEGAPHHQGCFWERFRANDAVRANPPPVLYCGEGDE